MRLLYEKANLPFFPSALLSVMLGITMLLLSSPAFGFNTLRYNRAGNMIEGTISPGQPFLMEGDVTLKERSVRVYFTLSRKGKCPRLDLNKVKCPAVQNGNAWACQEWRRSKARPQATNFKVLIPRLRWAFSRYCFQVAFFESLMQQQVQRLVQKMFGKLRLSISKEWEKVVLPPKSSSAVLAQAKERILNFVRGMAPQPKNLLKVRIISRAIVTQALKGDLAGFVGNIDSPTRRKNFQKFLNDEMYQYAQAYLRSRSTERRFFYMSHLILLKPHVQQLLKRWVNGIGQTALQDLQKKFNSRPVRGREPSLITAMKVLFNQYLNRNYTLFEELLGKQPKFGLRWAQLIRESCNVIRESHRKKVGWTGFEKWRRQIITSQQRSIPKTSTFRLSQVNSSSQDHSQLSCYQYSDVPVKDFVMPGYKVLMKVSVRNNRVQLTFLPNRRVNIYDFAEVLARSAQVHKSKIFYEAQLSNTEAKVLGAIGDYLALVTTKSSNMNAGITMGVRRYVDYFLSTDVGMAGVFLPGFNGLQFTVMPYFGVHLYFKPVLNTIPLSSEDGFLRRFTMFIGITILPFQLRNESVNAVGALGAISPMLGFGIRLTDFVRFGAGVILYRNKSLHPFLEDLEGELAISGFASISVDLNVIQMITNSFRQGRITVRTIR